MARTRASVGAKISAGKSNKARCSAAPPPSTPSTSGTSDKSSRGNSGGNPVCPRETPKWQKPITNFFVSTPSNGADVSDNENEEPKTKRNVIESDDETELEVDEPPKNRELDESILLEPLNGENSHKIDEYYKENKSNKENVDENRVKNGKRDREDTEESEQASKKVKIS
ncbi:uncharacterized protein [Epargyreus clarus]|uniref:uncharacterized protein isoform X2 n=1 Tax=Epargyreus clarus TaxID=520877 RepID=UPI003C2C99FD